MRRKLFLFLLLIGQLAPLMAQQHLVSGSVTDTDGEPLIGAYIVQKGTSNGISTDVDGSFQGFNVPLNSTIVVSYVGFDTREVVVTSNTMHITLNATQHLLDEIIVVAYGTASKAGYTGSASTIKKNEIAKAQVSSVSRLLQGSSGIQSVSSSGQPGSDAEIFIRGIGSLNAESTPLYIVDGAPYDGALNSINPNDIESINVLKDAAATSIYGSRAANGLVIITTKQGRKNQKTRIDASFRYGVSSRAQKSYQHVSTDQYFELTWEALRNTQLYINGSSPANAAQYATNNLTNRLSINPYGLNFPNPVGTDGRLVNGATPLWDTNWLEHYEQEGKRSEVQLNITGGSNSSVYYVSLGYLNEGGIAPGSDFERFTGRVNMKSDLTPWLRLTTNISLNHSLQNAPLGYDSSSYNPMFQGVLIPSFYPVYAVDTSTGIPLLDTNGNLIYDYGNGANGITRPSGASPNFNHLGDAIDNYRKNTRDIASVRASLDVDLYKGLTYTGSLNVDYNALNYHRYENPEYGYSSMSNPRGYVHRRNTRVTGFTANNILNYRTVFNEIHNLKLMAGQEYYEYNNNFIEGERSGFASLGMEEPTAASQLDSFDGYSTQYKLLSFFGNAEYNYNSKYFLSGSLRTDGSSRFSKDSRWGTFWSVGASWRINEEDFLKDNSVLSRLTLRSSYGGQGNDKVGMYAYQGLYQIQNNLGESGFTTEQLANHALKWETNLNLNIGLDFGLYRNRVTGTVEFFNRQSKDLLFQIPRPTSTGYSSYYANTGSLRNRGVELQLNVTAVKTKDWQWDIHANATHYKNKITNLPEDIVTSYQLRREGGSVYDWFLVEWAGIDPDDGLPMWYKTTSDGERVTTKVYDEANRTESKIIAGSSLPDLMGGFGTSLKYKDFELSALFAYSIGGKIYDRDKPFILNQSSAGRAMSTETLNRWTPENPYTDVPRVQTVATQWTSVSTRFLHDASYMRMKNLSVSYNVPSNVLKNVFLSACRVYMQAENLFTIYGTEGLDPEQAVNGLSYMRYPNARTLSFGINVTY